MEQKKYDLLGLNVENDSNGNGVWDPLEDYINCNADLTICEGDDDWEDFMNEDAKDVMKAKKIQKQIETAESRMRLHMYELADRMQAHTVNITLSDKVIKSYQKNVTTFMRDMISFVKKMK